MTESRKIASLTPVLASKSDRSFVFLFFKHGIARIAGLTPMSVSASLCGNSRLHRSVQISTQAVHAVPPIFVGGMR
jgi:hypothetical protein